MSVNNPTTFKGNVVITGSYNKFNGENKFIGNYFMTDNFESYGFGSYAIIINGGSSISGNVFIGKDTFTRYCKSITNYGLEAKNYSKSILNCKIFCAVTCTEQEEYILIKYNNVTAIISVCTTNPWFVLYVCTSRI